MPLRVQPLTAASSRIFLYSVFSTLALAATIANACRAHSNFYSVAIYLSNSSRSVLVLANFGFLSALLSGRVFQRIFFGSLQPREVERLYDQTWMFVTESLLAFTIFRDEFDVPFLLMFGFLLFVKCFHWLMADRVESIDQTPYPGPPTLFHIRINALFALLSLIDTTMFAFAVESTLTNGVGGMVLFASEYSILLATALNAILRYGLSILDLRRARSRGGENAPPWENKSMYIFYIELLTGKFHFLKLATYMTFFVIILTFYGLPLNIIRDVFVTARSFITRLRALVRYHNATRDMDRRYPDASEPELADMSDRTCIICREEMHARAPPQPNPNGDQHQPDGPNMTPKKLPCGHIFHFQCLRSWLERQQSCPTCRRTVLDNNHTPPQNQPPAQAQPGAPRPRPGAVPAQPPRPGRQLGWLARFLGIPQVPALDGQFPGAQAQGQQQPFAPPPQQQQQQHGAFQPQLQHPPWPGAGVVPPPGGPIPPPPHALWDHHLMNGWGQGQPPVFRGFYGPGQVWQPWGDAGAQPQQPPPPQQAPSPPRAPTPTRTVDAPPPSQDASATDEASLDPRRAAALAALRRTSSGERAHGTSPGPLNAPAPAPSSTAPSATDAPATAARPTGQPALPSLIPLYDPSAVQPMRMPAPHAAFPYAPPTRQGGTHSASTAPARGRDVPRGARGASGARTALEQLPPELSEAQLAALDGLTREAIEERIRVLDGVAAAAFRCVEELTRVRSVLPGAVAV
ncbi:hypothetical protein BD413DRAFT_715661, partial [Trametes elegans]